MSRSSNSVSQSRAIRYPDREWNSRHVTECFLVTTLPVTCQSPFHPSLPFSYIILRKLPNLVLGVAQRSVKRGIHFLFTFLFRLFTFCYTPFAFLLRFAVQFDFTLLLCEYLALLICSSLFSIFYLTIYIFLTT